MEAFYTLQALFKNNPDIFDRLKITVASAKKGYRKEPNLIIKDFLITKTASKIIPLNKLKSESNTCYIHIGWSYITNYSNSFTIHDSLLPCLRGFCHTVTAIQIGDSFSGTTLIKCSPITDAGNIIDQRKIPLIKNKTIRSISDVYQKIGELNADIITLNFFNKKATLVGTPQNDKNATYSILRDELDYFIDWKKSVKEIIRIIKSLQFPYIGTHIKTKKGEEYIIDEAQVGLYLKIVNHCPGKIIEITSEGIIVSCGKNEGLLITKLLSKNYEPVFIKNIRNRFI